MTLTAVPPTAESPREFSPSSSARGVIAQTRLAPSTQSEQPGVPEGQGVLALNLDPYPDLPTRPQLRLVGAPSSDLGRFAARFATAVVEVIAGDRGPQQLFRWTSVEVYEDLLARSRALQQVRTLRRRQQRMRTVVKSVHLSHPCSGVAEVSVHLQHGHRSRALAARIEDDHGRWRCTALEVG